MAWVVGRRWLAAGSAVILAGLIGTCTGEGCNRADPSRAPAGPPQATATSDVLAAPATLPAAAPADPAGDCLRIEVAGKVECLDGTVLDDLEDGS